MKDILEFKRLYVKLYKEMRKYIWSYEVVESLAYFEEAILHRFPDIKVLRNKFNSLYNMCREEMREDKDLEKAFQKIKDLLEEDFESFSYIEKKYMEE